MAICKDPLDRKCMHSVYVDGMVCDRCWEAQQLTLDDARKEAEREAKDKALKNFYREPSPAQVWDDDPSSHG